MCKFGYWTLVPAVVIALFCIRTSGAGDLPTTLLDDDLSGLRTGLLMDAVGAHTEYHYLSHASQRGNWAVSAFKAYGSQRAWRVIEEDGRRGWLQAYRNKLSPVSYTHLRAHET